jgi:hypothetical protein
MRQVLLDNGELRQALDAAVGQADEKVPDGKIGGASLSADGLQVTLAIIDSATQQTRSIILSASLVAAALIKFCMRRKIPLPRGASKYLYVSGDALGIRVVLKTESVMQGKG